MSELTFPFGRVVATPGAVRALTAAGESPLAYLSRHAHGDWGDLDESDKRANDRALDDGSRLLSAYHTRTGEKLWILTEADRSSTCILLPCEY